MRAHVGGAWQVGGGRGGARRDGKRGGRGGGGLAVATVQNVPKTHSGHYQSSPPSPDREIQWPLSEASRGAPPAGPLMATITFGECQLWPQLEPLRRSDSGQWSPLCWKQIVATINDFIVATVHNLGLGLRPGRSIWVSVRVPVAVYSRHYARHQCSPPILETNSGHYKG